MERERERERKRGRDKPDFTKEAGLYLKMLYMENGKHFQSPETKVLQI